MEYNGRTEIKYGQYMAVKMENHHLADKNGYVYVHRLVAEKMLGRDLKLTESVHHIDENKMNNDERNLMVFNSNSDHSAYHNGCWAVKIDDVWYSIKTQHRCLDCGKIISHKAKRCVDCARKYNQQWTWENGEKKEKVKYDINDIQKYILDGKSREEIGRIYGVSGNTVKKWMAKHNVPNNAVHYECDNVEQFEHDIQIYSLSSLSKKYGVSADVLKTWVKKYNVFVPQDSVICVETGKQYESGRKAMRDIAPDENAKVNAEKMYEAARNGEPFKGYHWIIEKKKNWGEVA